MNILYSSLKNYENVFFDLMTKYLDNCFKFNHIVYMDSEDDSEDNFLIYKYRLVQEEVLKIPKWSKETCKKKYDLFLNYAKDKDVQVEFLFNDILALFQTILEFDDSKTKFTLKIFWYKCLRFFGKKYYYEPKLIFEDRKIRLEDIQSTVVKIFYNFIDIPEDKSLDFYNSEQNKNSSARLSQKTLESCKENIDYINSEDFEGEVYKKDVKSVII